MVELLAVIAILAILMIIAIPNIINLVENAKMSTAEQAAIQYVKTIESDGIASTMFESNLKTGNFKISELDVKVNGKAPTDGTVTIENGKVVDAVLCINNYLVNYSNNTAKSQGKCEQQLAYSENLLNGTDPVLKEGLIPVTIDDDGTVKYADTKKKWYSYESKQWANAVILSSESSKKYNVGQIIQEIDIESYFVWIPRYRYKLWNVSNTETNSITYTNYLDVPNSAREIEIVFENKNTTPSNGSTNGSWLTHPAFTAFDSNGIWVGKFETGYKGATSVDTAQVNTNDPSKIIVKPNVYSWRNVTVGNIFAALYNYKRELDSHMMKNTEWGAVAYLSHSKFGINGPIRINNNSAYLTGYASVNQPTCGWTNATNEECNKYEKTNMNADGTYTKRYNNEVGYLASTTGNITGIYDMSGGSHEYVAGYIDSNLSGSGFNPKNYDSKYYDVYKGTTFNDRILGDAVGELGPFSYLRSKGSEGNTTKEISGWYANEIYFVSNWSPWFIRGGFRDNGVTAGAFYATFHIGRAINILSARLVLSPQN